MKKKKDRIILLEQKVCKSLEKVFKNKDFCGKE